eukprot:SAG31_NODE_3237_length_4508_cov_28.486278_5_plen_160_part_00
MARRGLVTFHFQNFKFRYFSSIGHHHAVCRPSPLTISASDGGSDSDLTSDGGSDAVCRRRRPTPTSADDFPAFTPKTLRGPTSRHLMTDSDDQSQLILMIHPLPYFFRRFCRRRRVSLRLLGTRRGSARVVPRRQIGQGVVVVSEIALFREVKVSTSIS